MTVARWSLLLTASFAVVWLACSDHSESASEHPDAGPHGTVSAEGGGSGPFGPSCDEDNPIKGTTEGTLDKLLPEAVIQFERQRKWGCAHREWHETRQWEYIKDNPAVADRWAYVQKTGWQRAPLQEGEAGTGIDFLAMHRAMVATLRDRFPEHADLFAGWPTVPTKATEADPLPNDVDGGAPGPFFLQKKQAITRVETDPKSFPSDDELGRFIETPNRPTAAQPFFRTDDLTTGLHRFIHTRFDDVRSPVHMELFSRNIENQTFFRFHGWIDRIWTQYRTALGRDDATDRVYLDAMEHACMHMGLGGWNADTRTCKP